MSLRAFVQQWWPSLLFSLSFLGLGMTLLPRLGLQYDETLFATPQFRDGEAAYSVTLLGHQLPLMLMTYVGALKTWLYAPILAVFRPSYLTVRLPVLLLGVVTVGLFVRLLHLTHSRRAAWIGGCLLATDTTFLLTTCFDWGPTVLQHFLLVAGLAALWRFSWKGARWSLFGGYFALGLGLWDKASFLWILGGLAAAVVLVFPREFVARLTLRNAGLAAAGFCLGAFPVLLYNATSTFATFRSTTTLGFEDFEPKVLQARYSWDGRMLFTLLPRQPPLGSPLEPQGPVERASFRLRSVVGPHETNRLEPAFWAALLLFPWLWQTRARKALLFCLAFLTFAWLLMALTRGAGGSVHHVVLLWPIPHMFIAIAFAEGSRHWRPIHWQRAASCVLAVVMAYLVAQNLLLTNEYLYRLVRFGGDRSWSDAIYPLSEEAGKLKAPQIVIDDWGIWNQLVLLHRGTLPLAMVTDSFLSPAKSEQEKAFETGLLEQGVWVGHTPEFQELSGWPEKITQAAAAAGFRKELLEVVADRNGRPTFEIFHFVRPAGLPN